MNVTENIKSMGAKAHDIRTRAADSLESAADSVRAAGTGSAGAISGLAHGAGRKLETTASFVRPTCAKTSFFGGFRNRIRRHPLRSLALATALGLVAGITCRR